MRLPRAVSPALWRLSNIFVMPNAHRPLGAGFAVLSFREKIIPVLFFYDSHDILIWHLKPVHKNTHISNETLFKRTNPLRLWCTRLNNLHQMCADITHNAPRLHGIIPSGTTGRELFWIFSRRFAAGALHLGRWNWSYHMGRVVTIPEIYLKYYDFREKPRMVTMLTKKRDHVRYANIRWSNPQRVADLHCLFHKRTFYLSGLWTTGKSGIDPQIPLVICPQKSK